MWLKTTLAWLLLVVLAISNGILRDRLLEPLLGSRIALPLSGILLAFLIFLCCWLLLPWFGRQTSTTWLLAGCWWVILTVAFEYLFGHFVLGMPWHDIHQVFDVSRGNLFSLALLSALCSPLLAARLRGRIF